MKSSVQIAAEEEVIKGSEKRKPERLFRMGGKKRGILRKRSLDEHIFVTNVTLLSEA